MDPEIVRQHITAAADAMRKRSVDALLLVHPPNQLGFGGLPFGQSDRFACVLITADGNVAGICPGFEADRAEPIKQFGILATWEEHEDPFALTAELLRQLNVASGRLAVDGRIWLASYERLQAANKKLQFVNGQEIIDEVRIRKSDTEVQYIRKACEVVGKAMLFIRDRLGDGLSELELSRLTSQYMYELAGNGGPLVQSGPVASIPHSPCTSRRVQPGDAVVVDNGCNVGGYVSDITRTFAVGEINQKIKDAYKVVVEAQRAAIEALRVGATCESIDRAARKVIADAGYGQYFTHRLGHGLGLEGHEPPYLAEGNKTELPEGACVTIEPGIYVPGEFGIRIEDDVQVTANGARIISDMIPTTLSEQFK